jgi:hypothetical protein
MTPSLPVVLADPPVERPHPRVSVTRVRGRVNNGDGRQRWFALRYVVDGRTRILLEARTPATAARRASALVRTQQPRAVWVVDAGRTAAECWLHAPVWRPLERAAGDVQAAFVAWRHSDGREAGTGESDAATCTDAA